MAKRRVEWRVVVAYGLLIAAFVVVGGAYVYTRNGQQISDQLPSAAKPPAATRQPSTRQLPNIPLTDKLQSVTSDASPPKGWTTYKDTFHSFTISYPSDWQPPIIKDPHSSAPEIDEYSATFNAPDGTDQNSFSVSVMQRAYGAVIADIEFGAVEDDGSITQPPGALVKSIAEKDAFTFNSMPAVRYVMTIRNSSNAKRTTSVLYVIGNGSETFRYTPGEAIANTQQELVILKQLIFNT